MTDETIDVPTLQLEVLKKIQAELTQLRGGLETLNAKFEKLNSEVSGLRTETSEGFTRVRTEIAGLRGDMDVGFTAMRMQNDRRFLDHERRLRELEAEAER
ncbi:MAG: hypothetical protein QM817_06705 [Archangium sp.]